MSTIRGRSTVRRRWRAVSRHGRIACGLVALGIVALVPIYVFPSSPASPHLAQPASAVLHDLDRRHVEYLESPLVGHEFSETDNEIAYVVGTHHAVDPDYPANYQWVDSENRQPYADVAYTNGNTNSALGRLPRGSQYDAVVIARGRNGRYTDPREEKPMLNLTIIGFFANFNPQSQTWERAGPEPYVLELPVWRHFPRPCPNYHNGGAADPRFLWSDAGEPLVVIGTASRVSGVCKAVGMVDLRAVWPAFREHLEDLGFGGIKITFDQFTEIGKASKKERFEKNWAPFFPGPSPPSPPPFQLTKWRPWKQHGGRRQLALAEPAWPFFASSVFPRSILEVDPSLDTSERSQDRYVLSNEISLAVVSEKTTYSASSNCIANSLPAHWKKERFHQATPFYRVTMCPRGTCVPDETNTVLLGLIHYKMDWHHYRRMFVTMSTVAPFEIISVSPPLHFGSVKHDEKVVFSVSMAFFPTKRQPEPWSGESIFLPSDDLPGGYLNHGWLDDTIVVGAGLRDEACNSILVDVATALRGHTLCTTTE